MKYSKRGLRRVPTKRLISITPRYDPPSVTSLRCNNTGDEALISCSSVLFCGDDNNNSRKSCKFKTVISFGSNVCDSDFADVCSTAISDRYGSDSYKKAEYSDGSECLNVTINEGCRYRVVLSVGETDEVTAVREYHSPIVSSNASAKSTNDKTLISDYTETSGPFKKDDEANHFRPPLVHSDSLSVRSVPPVTLSASSLFIKTTPPQLPKRISKRREFILSMIDNDEENTRLVDQEKNENKEAEAIKNPLKIIPSSESQIASSEPSSCSPSSGFYSPSISSQSSYDSSHSPASIPKKCSWNNSFLSRDSDYFGSSSEEDESLLNEEEEGDEDENDDEDEDEDDDDDGDEKDERSSIADKEEEEEDVKDISEEPDDILGPLRPVIGFPGLRRMKRFASDHFFSKEYDLEQRIALEIKMREGTTKLLAACGGPKGTQSSQPHILEAAKSLLTSNERMTSYMAELQRRRSSKRPNLGACEPSLARVCLSDLRMPLLWKDIEHFKNKGDNRKFAVFVLLKIGTEIYDTVMVNPVDRSMTDICFDDVIVFNGISPNFDCTLEVYSHLLESDMLMASIPKKLKKTFHSSISRTVGRKLAASLRDELTSGDPGPKFELVASASLGINNISNNISTFDLNLSSNDNRPDELPLFGHFCCRLAAQPDCFTQERIAGSAKVPESGNAEPSWCRLYGWRLEVWESKEDAETSPHHPLSLSVDRNTEIDKTSPSVLQLLNNQSMDKGILTLSFKNPDECLRWLKILTQHVTDHERWGKAAEEEMEILTPQPSRHSFIMSKRGRFTSLYEETPLRDGSSSSAKSSTDDLSESLSFVNTYCTPAPMAPRTRAFTMSTRSSFRRWGSVRANMPFFKTKG